METTTEGDLSAEQAATFQRDGLLVVAPPWPAGLLDGLSAEFEARFQDGFHPGPEHMQDGVFYSRDFIGGRYHWKRIMDAWKISPNARAVALEPSVLSVLQKLYGRVPRAFQTLNFPVGTQQSAHSDAMYFNSEPDGYMCGVWVALEDVDMDAGPLVYYPGSHKLPTPSNQLVEAELGEGLDTAGLTIAEIRAERLRLFTAYCQRLIETQSLEPRYATVKKGEAVIWAANLLHGGSARRDPRRTRRSQVTHYLSEGSRLHRPIWSEGDIYWDEPNWVK